MRPGIKGLVFLSMLVLCGSAFAAAGKPSVRASARTDGGLDQATITVEAADSVGLDSVAIAWAEGDLTWQTQLSRATIDRRFRRSFSLRELFPAAADSPHEATLTVTVRNTRGATASTSVSLRPPAPTRKGNQR